MTVANQQPASARSELYVSRAVRFDAEAQEHARRAAWFSHGRVLAFLAGAVAALAAAWNRGADWPIPAAGMAVLAFIALVLVQGKILRAEDRARRYARVNRNGEARTTGRWRELPDLGEGFADVNHPFVTDLDLFGKSSLFQRISVAHTRLGQARLAILLSSPATAADIAERQAAVAALAPELELRQTLEAEALEAVAPPGRPPPDPEPVLAWAEAPPELTPKRWLVWSARVLPFFTAAGLAGDSLADLSPAFWALPLALQGLVVWSVRETTGRVFNLLTLLYPVLERYAEVLRRIESFSFTDPLTRSLAARLGRKGDLASRALKSLGRRLAWFEVRHNGLIYPLLDLFFCWDIHATSALESWKIRFGSEPRVWFEVLGEFEALSTLAGLVDDEPTFTFPEIRNDAACFLADGLGHPLLDAERRVSNDVRLPGPGRALLVTGSNMGGKSTLLRSMGLACVLSNAGAPVCASRLVISPFALRTCLNVSDSLESNESHFYAEVRRLKGVLEATAGSLPVLFLLDEILHGTNARERAIGARWLLKELLNRGALGAVTTHDMDLTLLPSELVDRVELVHFQEDVQAGKMTFDYRMRPGPVTAGNALRLMRLLGLEVPTEAG